MKIAYNSTLVKKKIFSKNKVPYSINIDEYYIFPFALWNLNEVCIDPSRSVHSTDIAHVCVYVIVATERPWSVRPNPLSLGLPMWSEIILKCILSSLWHNYVKCKNSIWSKHWVQHWKAERISLTQIVYVVSRLLSNTSSKRNLALRLLYSWYSSAMGIRSSFCAVLHYFGGEGKKKKKQIPHETDDSVRLHYHLTLELPYWSSFVHQWIAD